MSTFKDVALVKIISSNLASKGSGSVSRGVRSYSEGITKSRKAKDFYYYIQQPPLRNVIHGISYLAKHHGIVSLYVGIAPNLLRAILMNASQLASYDIIKLELAPTLGPYQTQLVASFLAGTLATTLTAPVE
jgi:hypothetical protein